MADINLSNSVVASSQTLNTLVETAKTEDPTLAKGLLGNATTITTTQTGVILTAAVTLVSTKYGLGLSSDTVTLVVAAAMVAAGAIAHWVQVTLYRRSLFGKPESAQPPAPPPAQPISIPAKPSS